VQNQWKEMFPSMITTAATLEVIHAGENDHLDGIVQLVIQQVLHNAIPLIEEWSAYNNLTDCCFQMFAEVQTLTPLVPTNGLSSMSPWTTLNRVHKRRRRFACA